MTLVENLIFYNPDGTQKVWEAWVDQSSDQVILAFGKAGKGMTHWTVTRDKFSQASAYLEAVHRSQKKQNEGYRINPNPHDASGSNLTPDPNTNTSKRPSVLAALDDDEGQDWFF